MTKPDGNFLDSGIAIARADVENSRLRIKYDRAVAWSNLAHAQIGAIDATTTLDGILERWCTTVLRELEVQLVTVAEKQEHALRPLIQKPQAKRTGSLPMEETLVAYLQAHPAGIVQDVSAAPPVLAAALAQLGMAKCLYCLIRVGDSAQDTLPDAQQTVHQVFLVAGFDARLARFRGQLATDDLVQFQMTAQHLELALRFQRWSQRLVAQQDELERRLALISRQSETIRQLSTPVLEIWDRILVLPVIGELSSQRGDELTAGMLQRLTETRSQCVIVDVTGVESMDSQTASQFKRMAQAAALLGAHCVMTGIHPQVARTLVNLGINPTEFKTFGDLRAGLKYCVHYLSSQQSLHGTR